MPKKLLKCVKQVKADLQKRRPAWSNKRVDRVARATCVKSTGQKFQHSSEGPVPYFNIAFAESGRVERFSFSFDSDYKVISIEEARKKRKGIAVNDPDGVIISGEAIVAGLSKNYRRYRPEVLKKAAPTMSGKPCQIDHSHSARDTFGIVHESWYDETSKTVEYISELDGEDPVSRKVEKGYVNSVSIGGEATVTCNICKEEMTLWHKHVPGEKYDKKTCEIDVEDDLVFNHLGFTPFPGVESASADHVKITMDDAIEDAIASLEWRIKEAAGSAPERTTMTTIGERTMPDEDKASLVEIERLKLQLDASNKKNEKLEKAVKGREDDRKRLVELESRQRSDTIAEIVAAQVELKQLEENDVPSAKALLEKSDQTVLDARLTVLREWLAANPPKQKQPPRGSGGRSLDLGNETRMPEIWVNEAKKARLSYMMFGNQPSTSAVRTVGEWEGDPQTGRWKSPLTEIVTKQGG